MKQDSMFGVGITCCALALTPILLYVAVDSSGLGHGDYLWAKVFFPVTMLSTHATGAISPPFLVFAVLQFPLYGVLLARIVKRRPARLLPTAALLAAAHAVAVALCFVIPMPNFS